MNNEYFRIFSKEQLMEKLGINAQRFIVIIKALKKENYCFQKENGNYIFNQNDFIVLKKQNELLDTLGSDQASSKQLFALFLASNKKIDTRGLKIGKEKASFLIKKSQKGEDINQELRIIVDSQIHERNLLELDTTPKEINVDQNTTKEEDESIMVLSQEKLISLIKEYNLKIEKELEMLNNKYENKMESIKKLISLGYKIEKYPMSYFEETYLVFSKVNKKELGMAVIVEEVNGKVFTLLKDIFHNKEISLYSIKDIDPLIKTKLEEETNFIIEDTREIYKKNLQKYSVSEFNVPLFNIKRNF